MTDHSKDTKELFKLISSSERILIISHINPDGDAIGSQLALYHYLLTKGIKASMMSPNNLQEFIKWMDGSDQVKIFIRERKKCVRLIGDADLIIMMDFNQANRLGDAEEFVRASKARKVIIDHHLNPGSFGDFIISDPSKCATAELVYEMIGLANGSPFINSSFAECIYVGIVTDTGNFVHGNYSPGTFRIVANLIEQGIRKEKILNLVYNNFSAGRMRLLGFALNQRMIVLPEHRTAYMWLTRADLDHYNHVKGDTEGFVNMPLAIRGVNFSVLFIEKEGFVKISLRSKGNFPTNEFATKYFGGGGHLNASGGEHYDTLDNTVSYFLSVLRENNVMPDEDL